MEVGFVTTLTAGNILLEISLHFPDYVPLPIIVHLLHGYSQNCYLVGGEFLLNLNSDFPCNPVNEISASFFQQIFPKNPAASDGETY